MRTTATLIALALIILTGCKKKAPVESTVESPIDAITESDSEIKTGTIVVPLEIDDDTEEPVVVDPSIRISTHQVPPGTSLTAVQGGESDVITVVLENITNDMVFVRYLKIPLGMSGTTTDPGGLDVNDYVGWCTLANADGSPFMPERPPNTDGVLEYEIAHDLQPGEVLETKVWCEIMNPSNPNTTQLYGFVNEESVVGNTYSDVAPFSIPVEVEVVDSNEDGDWSVEILAHGEAIVAFNGPVAGTLVPGVETKIMNLAPVAQDEAIGVEYVHFQFGGDLRAIEYARYVYTDKNGDEQDITMMPAPDGSLWLHPTNQVMDAGGSSEFGLYIKTSTEFAEPGDMVYVVFQTSETELTGLDSGAIFTFAVPSGDIQSYEFTVPDLSVCEDDLFSLPVDPTETDVLYLSSSSPSGLSFVPGSHELARFNWSSRHTAPDSRELIEFAVEVHATDNAGSGWVDDLAGRDFNLYDLTTDGFMTVAMTGHSEPICNDNGTFTVVFHGATWVPEPGMTHVFAIWTDTTGASAAWDDAIMLVIPENAAITRRTPDAGVRSKTSVVTCGTIGY